LKIIVREAHGARENSGFRIQTLGGGELHHSKRGWSFGEAQDVKKALDARVAQIRREYEERSRRLKSVAAEQLRKAAAQIEK